MTLSRRWNAGYFQGAYTYSKATDATSSGNTALNTAFNDESSISNSYGLSDFDRTHRLTVSYRYDLPFFRDSNGLKGVMLKDWALSGITIFQSGTPFSVIDSSAGSAYLATFLSFAVLGADLVPGASIASGKTSGDIHNRLDNYLNLSKFQAAAFIDPTLGCDIDPSQPGCTKAFGTLGRNIYRGPFQQNWDFSLIKNFRLTEKQSLRFTADFFNLWNHANFGNPAVNDVETYLGAADPTKTPFGKIQSTVGTPRLIQFQLRYAF